MKKHKIVIIERSGGYVPWRFYDILEYQYVHHFNFHQQLPDKKAINEIHILKMNVEDNIIRGNLDD